MRDPNLWIAVVAAVTAGNLAWVALTLAVARELGMTFYAVKLGAGPGITKVAGGVRWSVGMLLPLGSSVKFSPEGTSDDAWLRQTPLWRQLAIALVPWFVLLGALAAWLGATRVWAEAWGAWTAFFDVPHLPARVHAWIRETASVPLVERLGLVLAKVAGFNLLPLAPVAGGVPVMGLLRRVRPRWTGGYFFACVWAGLLWLGWVAWLVWTYPG